MSRISARKRRKLSPPESASYDHSAQQDSEAQPVFERNFSRHAAQWNLEQDYETKPRYQKRKDTKERLPIKTPEGHLELIQVSDEESVSETSSYLAEQNGEGEIQGEIKKLELKDEVPVRQQILEAKEALAKLAASINESAEENIGQLHALQSITASAIPSVTKLGLATQLAIYKDLIPDYRIRPMEEIETKEKLSKDVKKLRNFEQALVGGYQRYVKELARIASIRSNYPSEETSSLITVAVSCVCNLLKSVPHFNFRTDLLQICVSNLSRGRRNKDFKMCCDAVEHVFRHDEEGHASLEVVSMLSKTIKAKENHIDEQILNLFLHLRLLTEFAHKGSDTRIDKDTPRRTKLKETKQFRTKKERKMMRERKAIEKEMKEADAIVGSEQRDQMQAETLKLVFSTYFRILKARTPSLMGPVLEGLVKYAHLINQDFFGDLLEALKDLIQDSSVSTELEEEETAEEDDPESLRNLTRESLLCVITAFALLEGQDTSKAASALQLDLSFFITHLYRTLYPAALNPDLELSSKSLHLPDPHNHTPTPVPTKVDVQTTIVLLLRSLQAVLLPTQVRSVSPLRLAAFIKQVLTMSLHIPEKSCTAILGTVNQVLKIHNKKVAALWNTEERKGDGQFNPLKVEMEGSNPFASTVWEGELLKLHYAPSVREGVSQIEKAVIQL